MSHFVAIVLVPKTTTNVAFQVKRLLAPFEESKRVPRYRRTCSCAEYAASNKAREDCAAKFGPFTDIREKFLQKLNSDPELSKLRETDEGNEKISHLWQEHFKDWNRYEEERRAFWLPQTKPDTDCECKGKGWYYSTSNPNGKWDWYQIGGRWTGFLAPEYDPNTDPNNIETCRHCRGTGTRTDFPIWAKGDAPLSGAKPVGYESGKCNGCNGTGKSVKWPTDWKHHSSDISPATVWRDLILGDESKKFTPFAVVTPQKEWIERGQMGMFACVSDEKNIDAWGSQVKELAVKYADDCLAVVVDLHT